ncbi:MAG TPA: nucleotidyltransferase family protein, partial [Hyphomicrobiales bacterium]|nr:nucleotidyltransferase family protein [Hyphomicrobiales bacterium]
LAAGLSTRMGGPNKLLQPYRGEPLLAHVLRVASSLSFRDCLAITGRDAEAIEALAKSFSVRCVKNERYRDGLGNSIAAGADALERDVEGVFVVLGDMPGIDAAIYRRLMNVYRPGAIVLPVYKESRGHPVLFCSSYRRELAGLSGDEGARSILKRNAGAVLEIKTENAGVLRDLDVPADFERGEPSH